MKRFGVLIPDMPEDAISIEQIDEEYIRVVIRNFYASKIKLKAYAGAIKNTFGIYNARIEIIPSAHRLKIIVHSDIQIDLSSLKNVSQTVLSQMLAKNLENAVTKRKLIRITKDMEIPLLGIADFGLIDRGTNLIQVRGVTGCPLNCLFCSVGEGPYSKTRLIDYFVDSEYLAEWFYKLADFKGKGVEAHLDGQGEPSINPELEDLVEYISAHKNVEIISLQSNGIPLNEKRILRLRDAGLSRINLTINSLDPRTAAILAGTNKYDLEHVLEVAKIIVDSGIELLIAPVWVPGFNDNDMVPIIRYAKEIGAGGRWPALGIQKYEIHHFGRKVRKVKAMQWKEFYEALRELENETNVRPLILTPKHFGTHKRKRYPVPFRNGEHVDLEIVLPGRMKVSPESPRTMFGKARDRLIHIVNTHAKLGEHIRAKIIRARDGIFIGIGSKSHK